MEKMGVDDINNMLNICEKADEKLRYLLIAKIIYFNLFKVT